MTSRRTIAAVGTALTLAVRLHAQAPTGYAHVDSANVARAAWGNASAAMRANDLAAALREVEHAARAWPTQDAYVWGRVIVTLATKDTAAIARALAAYADAGFGRAVRTQTRFAPYAGAPAVATAIARVEANLAPMIAGRLVATLPDSATWPEGMDYDPRAKRYYVGSIRHRTIVEVNGTTTRELMPRDQAHVGSILGVRVDTAAGVLWATTAGLPQMEGFTPADSTIAALLRIRISDGRIERRWDLAPSADGHTLGDLAVGANGDVYVTDSREPVLYRLKKGADSLEKFTHPLFRSLQGIAPLPDGHTLYVADWSHGLLRVDLATRQVLRIDDAPHSSSLGCDGIVLYHGDIIAVQNGSEPRRIMRYSLDATGQRITRAEVIDRHLPLADEPTIGALVGDEFVYVANSQWDKYDDNGARIAGTPLARPVLLGVRLKP